MLPPHQPPRRKKIEANRPVRTAKAEAPEKTEGGAVKRTLRVLQRRAPISAVAAMRQRRQTEC